jgi:sec-independent protein translocase protein TatB
MFDIGFWELALVSLVALLVIGPERLPKVARTAGLWLGRARRMIASAKADIDREIKAEELREILEKQAHSNPLEEIVSDSKEALDGFRRDTERSLDARSDTRKDTPSSD